MNIVLMTGTFPSRTETFIYRKAVALAKRGHRVTVATRGHGDWSLYPDPLPPGLEVLELAPDHSFRRPARVWDAVRTSLVHTARAPRAARTLFQQVRTDKRTVHAPTRQLLRHLPLVERRADVVHFEFMGLGVMYPLASELLGAPTVVSCRGTDIHMLELQPASEREASIAALQQATAVHCVSSELASEVRRITGRTEGIWINRPAVDVDSIVRMVAHDRGPVRILTAGRLTWKKGFDYLLTALARVAKAGIAFRAEIIGEGELKKSLRYAIEDLGLESCVTLAGAMSSADVLARMRESDVFVLPSLQEGISNAVLEAMATGLPIVTTAVGGMPEAVTDGQEGFVVPVRDVDALARGIITLAGDAALRARMGSAARRRAENEFSIVRQVASFEALYEAITR